MTKEGMSSNFWATPLIEKVKKEWQWRIVVDRLGEGEM